MNNLHKTVKLILATSLFTLMFACDIFGVDVTGVWIISTSGDSKMQLQQNGNQIIGLAYFQGQNQGNIYGQINNSQIVLQIRNSYTGTVSYSGIVSSDGNSMQLTGNQTGGQTRTLTAFKSG